MAQLIRAKKLSAREALAEHIKQIDRVNPQVNAIVTLMAEMATEAAAKPTRAGARRAARPAPWPPRSPQGPHRHPRHPHYLRLGSSRTISYRRQSIVVERMRRAGAIIVGQDQHA